MEKRARVFAAVVLMWECTAAHAGDKQGFVGILSNVLNTKTLLNYRDKQLSGTANDQNANQAADALDSVGSGAARTTAIASGGSLMGAYNAAAAGPLISIAKSERRALQYQAQTENDYLQAVLSGDSARIAKAGEARNNAIATGAQFKPNLGSTADHMKRMFDAFDPSELGGESQSSSRSSPPSLAAKIQTLANSLSSLFSDSASEVPPNAPQAIMQNLPNVGYAKWRVRKMTASYSNLPPQPQGCFPGPLELKDWMKEEEETYKNEGCKIGEEIRGIDVVQFNYECNRAGGSTAGNVVFLINNGIIKKNRSARNNFSEMHEETEYSRCEILP